MQYDFADIHVQHVLSADPEERKRFNVPRDLAIAAGWVISALILALVAAIVMHVDKIVPARGILETPLGVFTIRNMQAGYIKNLLVREGDSVTKGQTLVEFDSRMIELEIDKIKTDKEVAAREAWADALLVIPQLAKKDRQILNQRLSHIEKPITMHGFDSRLIHYTNEVQSVFTANRQAIASKLHDLDAQLRLQQQSLVLQKAELEKLEILVIDGFQSHSSLLSKQRAYLDMQATEQGLKADITGFRGELSRLDRDQSKQLAELAMNQLRGIDSAIGAYERSETQLAALEKTLDRMSVKAPFAGTVDHIFLKGEGEYVNDDVGLINLRQNLSSKELEIDIILPGSLAIWVKPGMNFRAFAANNNPEDHGYLKGEITFFAQSTQDVKDVLSYRLKGRIKEFVLKPGISKEALIRPGMDLRVEIITGTRSVMSYLLDPIQKTLRETMTEPN